MNKEHTIQLRAAVPEDAASLLDIYAPYVADTAISFEYSVPSLAEFTQRIQNVLKRFPYLVAEKKSSREILGYVYASPFHPREAYKWAVETSIYIRQGYTGLGLGRRLYEALERILKEQHIITLYACIAAPPGPDEFVSDRSILFHQHMGYDLIAEFDRCAYKFGRWYNMVWMEKNILPHADIPKTPLTFDEVRSHTDVMAML